MATLKKISEREDQYLYVARRTFTNLFLGVTYLYREASRLKNETLPETADISLLKISICIFVSAISIQVNRQLGRRGEDPAGVGVQISEVTDLKLVFLFISVLFT